MVNTLKTCLPNQSQYSFTQGGVLSEVRATHGECGLCLALNSTRILRTFGSHAFPVSRIWEPGVGVVGGGLTQLRPSGVPPEASPSLR